MSEAWWAVLAAWTPQHIKCLGSAFGNRGRSPGVWWLLLWLFWCCHQTCKARYLGSWNTEAVTKEVVEGHLELFACLGKPEHHIASFPSIFADGPAGDLPLCDEGADVILGAVGVQRDVRTLENQKQFILVAV